MATAIGDLVATMRMNTRPFTAGAANIQRQLRGLDRTTTTTMARIRRTLGVALGQAALAGGTAVAAGFVVAANSAENFNQAMNSSLAIMQDVNAEMRADMKRTAFEIARVTKFSGKEAAESYFFLASAGLDAKQSIAALPVVAQFAQAGMFDMARATDLLTDAQSALGKTVKDPIKNLKNMTKLGDQLVKANTLANASVEQFSEALTNKAAASMRLLNIETAEGIAVLAAFADQGLKGAEAGTAFSIVLRDLTTKAIKEKEAFKALGVNVFDSSGKFQGMADIVGDLETALFGLSDEQKKATLLQLGFSDKSVQFTQVLLGMSDKIRDYTAGINEAGGTMKDVADNQLTPFAKGMAAVGAAFSEFSVDAATGPMADLGQAMEGLAQPGGDLIAILNSIVDSIDSLNTAILKFDRLSAKTGRVVTFGRERDELDLYIEQLDDAIAAREKATRERLLIRAGDGKPGPLTEAEKAAKRSAFVTRAQELANRSFRKIRQDMRKLDAQAANQERAKDMAVIAANVKAADKIREGFIDSPLQEFTTKLAELEKLRGAPSGLSEEEFQRASGEARQAAIEAMKNTPVAEPMRDAADGTAMKVFLDRMATLQRVRRDSGWLTDEEFQRLEGKARQTLTEAMKRIPDPEVQAEAMKIRQGLRTPTDKLIDDILRVRSLMDVAGGLTDTEAQREIARLQMEAEGDKEPLTPTAGRIAERGTDVAFQAILAAMRDDTVDDAIKETAGNTKTAADRLVDIDANLAVVGIADV